MAVDAQQDVRSERIQARATKQAKDTLERAAAVQGVSLSDFLISTGLEKAMVTLQSHELLQLGADDSRLFAEALLNPPEPSEALRAAKERHAAEVLR